MTEEEENENIMSVSIEDEMRGAYIDYSMSVIISRALPDVRDGLKPVHRRVLYGMHTLGLAHNRSHKKSARIVGEVLGKYHPHGDSSVYDTMVRMAQDWSLRYPLVDGQGNFGSVDGDNAAAMRYTEARLQRIAEEMLADLEKDVVDFVPNFDDTETEPSVLPARIPNLLINGASGIAVGMATNIAPHNLSEVLDGVQAYIDNNDITIAELMQHIKAPDFPTGGIIYGYQGVKKAFETGRGRVVLRAVTEIEIDDKTGKQQIIVHELPYQVNKATLIAKTADLVNEKRIEGITAIRDESDRDGMRIVYELRKDAIADVVLNMLFKYTALQSSFSVNNVALAKGRPVMLTLKDMIKHFVEHRHEVVVRRTKYDLAGAEKRLHLLEGLMKALDVIDLIIAIVRSSDDTEHAKNCLIGEAQPNTQTRFFENISLPNEPLDFSELQAKEILNLRLQRLTGLELNKLKEEYENLQKTVDYYREVLASFELRMQIIKDELTEIKEKYGDERRTKILQSGEDILMEDLIPNEEMLITISHEGYIKRTSLSEFRVQGRGGVGSRATSSKEDDFTELMFAASNHNYLLIFTDAGKVYWLRVFELPEGSKASKGRPVQNLIAIDKDEHIQAVINVESLSKPDYIENNFLVFCTEQGLIKKTSLEAYSRPRQNGINAITINEGDKLLDVKLTDGTNDIVMAVRSGRAIRFHEQDVRSMGRTAAGVRGIRLDEDNNDRVIGMVCISRPDAELFVVSENGYGKRSILDDYRITKRGGKGVRTLNLTDKTGALVSIKSVVESDHLMIIRRSGVMIRFEVSSVRSMGRATQGVRLVSIAEGDEISSVARIDAVEVEEEILDAETTTTTVEQSSDTNDSANDAAVVEE
ncbi:MAG: DNA gyrase subunit A [Bernardetiaceae bacterium]|nr:DNA gyrase subunit A [Bernardetiaceae bacterium]